MWYDSQFSEFWFRNWQLAAGAAVLKSEDSLAFSVDGLQNRPGFLCRGTYYLFILSLKSVTFVWFGYIGVYL